MESTLSGPTVVSTHKQSPMTPEFLASDYGLILQKIYVYKLISGIICGKSTQSKLYIEQT